MSGDPFEASSSSSKRKQKMVSFESFPETEATAINSSDCFEQSWKVFVSQCCTDPVDGCNSFRARRTYVEKEKFKSGIPVFFIEEIVPKDVQRWCYDCLQWKKYIFEFENIYHLIVPRESDWNKQSITKDILYENHILHGKFHWNRDGHLLHINGLDGGSTISGREVMDLWDRVCDHLKAREVTLIDCSIKRSIDLRLFLGIGYRQTWFSRWGYRLPQSSDKEQGEITEEGYNRALDVISSLPLDDLIRDSRGQLFHDKLKKILDDYGKTCEKRLTTLEGLFNYILLTRNFRIPRRTEVIHNPGEAEILNLVLNLLKENRHMTRQAILEVAWKHRTKLSPFLTLLKAITIEDYAIIRTTHPVSKQHEFTLYQLETMQHQHHQALEEPAGIECYNDLITVYKAVRLTYPESEPMRIAIQTIMDAQNLSKRYY